MNSVSLPAEIIGGETIKYILRFAFYLLEVGIVGHRGGDAEVASHLGLDDRLVDEGVVTLGQDSFRQLLLVGGSELLGLEKRTIIMG